jgi:flagellin-like protein
MLVHSYCTPRDRRRVLILPNTTMQFKQLLNDDDAVSPVIGVILMVAITVILAAVIGTFVLGLGDQVQQTSPTAQFSFDYDQSAGATSDGAVTITHDGGDGISAGQISTSGSGINESGTQWHNLAQTSASNADSTVTAGQSGVVGVTTSSGANINVVWQASDGDRSSTLAEWEQ